MNIFFGFNEIAKADFPLMKIAQSYDLNSLTLDKLDSPLAKDVSSNEAGKEKPEIKETRELTEEEKSELKTKLGWTDKQLAKCTIDDDGVIHYRTDREDLEGKTSETGVPYERKRVTINGIEIDGVFPVFNSRFDVQLPEDLEKSSNAKQFKECNRQLKEAIENNPELRSQFDEEQLQDIADGDTPRGYVWHHNEEKGKMQLVKTEDHDRTQGGAAHTGGRALWAGCYGNSDVSDSTTSDTQGANQEVE